MKTATKQCQPVTSELLDRLPPQNLEAERGVIGSLLLLQDACDEVAGQVRAEDFYADANQRLFGHIMAMHDAGGRVDAVLLVDRLKQAGDFEAIGGSAYLAEVMQTVPHAAHAEYYARLVRQHAIKRALVDAGREIVRDGYDQQADADETLRRCEESIFAIHDRRGGTDAKAIGDVLLEAFADLDARIEGKTAGIPTGFADLDKLTGGLHDGELFVLAGRPGMGKSALAANIADHVAVEAGQSVVMVSLEMSALELGQRLLCSRARVAGYRCREGYTNEQERQRLIKASSELATAKLSLDDAASRTVGEISAVCRRLARRQGLDLLIVDYLQLITPDNPRDPRQEQVAGMSRRLKGLARELSIPVVCLSQLNRQGEGTHDNRPKLSHLRESGAIEQDADVVAFVHRDEYYRHGEAKDEVKGQAVLILAKQRNGPTDEIKLTWRESYTRFENAAESPQGSEF